MDQSTPQPLSAGELAEVRELLDRQRIHACLLRYARGVDRLDVDLIRSAFWADARDSHGQMDGTVEEFIDAWVPTQVVRDGCQHAIHNHHVEFGADPGTDGAHAETYFQVAIHDVGQPTTELVGGRYLDHFTRRDGEWRIARRLVVLDWQCTADASAMDARLSRSHRGARDASDPSYERPVRSRRPPVV